MQTPYKSVTLEIVENVIALCQKNSIPNGGLLEVYDDPGGINRIMVIINGISGEKLEKLNPIGAFFCNYMAVGVISLEEDPKHDETQDKKLYRQLVKETIDQLIEGKFPERSHFCLD
jgi:hypothetical protein|tara:strand:+ start:228 stop:578 length:351 start_codon:yes stop_codon:yes gene_type:complete